MSLSRSIILGGYHWALFKCCPNRYNNSFRVRIFKWTFVLHCDYLTFCLVYIGEDLMWACSIKRCWHYSLWFKARKYSFMYKVICGDKLLFSPQLFSLNVYTRLWVCLFFTVGNSSAKPAEIKIIDFGSACLEDRTVYSYIQVIPDLHFILAF